MMALALVLCEDIPRRTDYNVISRAFIRGLVRFGGSYWVVKDSGVLRDWAEHSQLQETCHQVSHSGKHLQQHCCWGMVQPRAAS